MVAWCAAVDAGRGRGTHPGRGHPNPTPTPNPNPNPIQAENKFFCDACCSLQEANKCMRIKRLPNILALHLKRFKYIEQVSERVSK